MGDYRSAMSRLLCGSEYNGDITAIRFCPDISVDRCQYTCMLTDATLWTNNSQHCWTLHVVSVCTPCCMLLRLVGSCCAKFETGKTFSPVQTDALPAW